MNKHFFRALVTDTRNRLRYGQAAPRYGEQLWVDARQTMFYLPSATLNRQFGLRLRQASGRVVSHWPRTELESIETHPKVRACLRHWLEGLSWQASGAYDYMMTRIQESPNGLFDGCASLEDIVARYDQLDGIYASLRQGGSFKSVADLVPDSFREVGGVMMHIGPGGEPVFGGGGAHRFAMAKALGLEIPVQVGLVHETAIDRLDEYRSRNGHCDASRS